MKYLTGWIAAVALIGCQSHQEGVTKADFARKAVIEATIGDIQDAIKTNKTSCLDVVNAYIERIETYDQSTGLNAITYKNFDAARQKAGAADAMIIDKKPLPKLFCVPMLVKDNMDVKGLPTTAGSKML
ncbi:MAG TPA: hypothetical protein ENJ42_05900, partial [Hellea balneolensis]|nr:hypothetical protein [Hellea balneolensis]